MEKIKNNPLENCEGDADGYTRRSASSSGENDFFSPFSVLILHQKEGNSKEFSSSWGLHDM